MFPNEKLRSEFTEFHASDLFAGTKAFRDVPEDKRHGAILKLLQFRSGLKIPYVYSAVDMQALKNGPMKSASWIDVAFFMTACAVDNLLVNRSIAERQKWISLTPEEREKLPWPSNPVSLMIIDEQEQAADRAHIRRTFRRMRQPLVHAMEPHQRQEGVTSFKVTNRLRAPIDDLFFGSSADSLGLQVADICNWVMWRKLKGEPEDEFFRELAKGPVASATPEPEWTQYRHLLRAHDRP